MHRGTIEMEFGDGSTHRLEEGGFARVDAATVRSMRNVGEGDADLPLRRRQGRLRRTRRARARGRRSASAAPPGRPADAEPAASADSLARLDAGSVSDAVFDLALVQLPERRSLSAGCRSRCTSRCAERHPREDQVGPQHQRRACAAPRERESAASGSTHSTYHGSTQLRVTRAPPSPSPRRSARRAARHAIALQPSTDGHERHAEQRPQRCPSRPPGPAPGRAGWAGSSGSPGGPGCRGPVGAAERHHAARPQHEPPPPPMPSATCTSRRGARSRPASTTGTRIARRCLHRDRARERHARPPLPAAPAASSHLLHLLRDLRRVRARSREPPARSPTPARSPARARAAAGRRRA